MAEPRAFVCGHPVAHSRSPLIHGYWLREMGIAGSYERIDITPEAFPGFLTTLRDGGFAGGNVTIPHKEAAFALVERRDAAADAIQAVNTLWIENGKVVGGNTDAYGFAANLDDSAPVWRDAAGATVLGAGGAARAVVHALRHARIERIRIANRTLSRAEELAAGFGNGVSTHEWTEVTGLLESTDILVNTTSLGMPGQPEMGVDLAALPDSAIVTDIVYVPLMTPLLRQARARGLRTVDGLGMLLHQAVDGFEHWFGVRPTVSPGLRAAIIDDLEAVH
jgi:shikimate dehydrogenase